MVAKEEIQSVGHMVATGVIPIRDENVTMVPISIGDRLEGVQHLHPMDQAHQLNAENCLLPLEVLLMAQSRLPSLRRAQQGLHLLEQPEQ